MREFFFASNEAASSFAVALPVVWTKRRLNVHIDYRTPTVTSVGGRDGSVRSADGLIDLQVAGPQEMGGPGGKTNPEDLFADWLRAHPEVRDVTVSGDDPHSLSKMIMVFAENR
jgi:hypothetical protein